MCKKLLTKELIEKLPPLYHSEEVKDPIVHARFFHPYSTWEWYVIEYDPDKRVFFGLVKGFYIEMGYFTLDELESIQLYRCRVERDLYFKPVLLSEVRKLIDF